MRSGLRCTPGISTSLAGYRIPRAGLLPFHLGGQAGTGPRRVRLRFEERDVLDRFVGGNVLDVAEPGAGAGQITGGVPELWCLQTRLLPVRPAAGGPPPPL